MLKKRKQRFKTGDFRLYAIKNKNVAWTKFKNESIAVNLQNGYCYTFNPIGSFIWNHIDGTKSSEDILGEIIKRYRVDGSTARSNLKEFLFDLRKRKLIILSHKK